jgi:hypothetical protein
MKKNLRVLFLTALLCLTLTKITLPAQESRAQSVRRELSKTEFEIIEGKFHDGLGTFAEVTLANELIALAKLAQQPFDVSRSRSKMREAIAALPESHPGRAVFEREIGNIEKAAQRGTAALLGKAAPRTLARVRHTPREFAAAKAGDVKLVFTDGSAMPVSVKTDKSGRVAVAEGQTPDLGPKWAERYFRVSAAELSALTSELGFASLAELKAHYLNVARLVALTLMRKLELKNCEPTDFSQAAVGNLEAARYLLRQLLHYKRGSDHSHVIIFDRQTGEVRWDSLLETVDIDRLTAERISFTPARPRNGHHIGTTFGLRIDGRTVVTFQIKHKRGKARGTADQYEFSDITTRLEIGRL